MPIERPNLNRIHDIYEVTYNDVVLAIHRNRNFFHSPESVERTIEYARSAGKALLQIPQVIAVYGDGFPYYVARLREEERGLRTGEIGRFQREMVPHYDGKVMPYAGFNEEKDKSVSLPDLRSQGYPSAGVPDPYGVEKAALNGTIFNGEPDENAVKTYAQWRREHAFEVSTDLWSCPTCVATGQLPNLRDPCAPCDLTSFKPRDILRMLHDVDIQVVVEGDPLVQTSTIRRVLHGEGIPSEDEYLGYVIQNAGEVFPMDVTVISKNDFDQGLGAIARPDGWNGYKIPAVKLWMHDEQYDWPFGLNFVFSMEPLIGRSADEIEPFLKARREFLKNNSVEAVLDHLAQLPRAHGRHARHPQTKNGIRLRMETPDAPFYSTTE